MSQVLDDEVATLTQEYEILVAQSDVIQEELDATQVLATNPSTSI